MGLSKLILWDKTGSDCPYVQRDKIALVEKGVHFEEKNVDLSNKSKEYLDLYGSLSPDPAASAKVPLLEHGEPGTSDYVKLIESNVILEYIEDVWGAEGPRLRPTDPKEAAAARMFAETFSRMMPWPLIRGDSKDALIAALKDYAKGMSVVERSLELYGKDGGDFLLGADFSVAECMTAPFVVRSIGWLKEIRGVDVVKLCEDLGHARLTRWMKAVLSRPSVLQTSKTFDPAGLKKVHPDWIKCDATLEFSISDGELVF